MKQLDMISAALNGGKLDIVEPTRLQMLLCKKPPSNDSKDGSPFIVNLMAAVDALRHVRRALLVIVPVRI